MKVQKFREEKERREKEAAAKVAREKEERERREAKEKARKEKEARALLAAERQARKERKEREQKKTEEKARKVALRKARLQNIAKGIKNIIRGESKLPFFIGGGIVIVFLLGFIIKGALPSTAPSPLTETSTIPALPSAALSEIPTNLTPTHTSVPSATLGSIVTITPSPLLTGSPVPTVTTLPAEIIDDFGVAMMLVPAGEFLMGSEVGDEAHYDERPPRTVYLDVYYIDKYEVTNAKYRDCVTSGSCQLPTRDYTRLHSNYFSDTYYDNYPVVNVNWFMAEAYCNWRRGQLPTEAQWEKAARGRDGRMFPWGERINCYKANIGRSDDGSFCNDDKGDTLEVGTYKYSQSPYGLYDMTGNLEEWVADWYSGNYYKNTPLSNPTGPVVGDSRVLRGGHYNLSSGHSTTYSRNGGDPNDSGFYSRQGFRCARDATP